MKAQQGKMSRNRQRKAAYAGQADKSSRNEVTLEKPIIGRFETVVEGGRNYQRIVHDDAVVLDPATGSVVARKVASSRREADAKKRRRQEAAWARCAFFVKNGKHDFSGERHDRSIYRSDYCITCGCPASEVVSA